MLAAVLNLDKCPGALQKAVGVHRLKALFLCMRSDFYNALAFL